METKNKHLILIIFLTFIFSSKSQIDKSSLINKIEASLILNYYKSNNQILSLDLNYDYIDTIRFEYLNDSIEYYNRIYFLFGYNAEFLSKLDSIKLFKNLYQRHGKVLQETAKLHINGLLAVRKNEPSYIITLSGNSFEGYNSVSDGINFDNYSIEDCVYLKYYNYLPQNIKIDTLNNEFNFYSEILNRNFNGEYFIDKDYNVYKLELRRGVIIGD